MHQQITIAQTLLQATQLLGIRMIHLNHCDYVLRVKMLKASVMNRNSLFAFIL